MVVDQLDAPPSQGGYVWRWWWIATLRQLRSRRRRSRSSFRFGVITGLLTAAVVMAAVIVMHWILTYQPLQLGSGRQVEVDTAGGQTVDSTLLNSGPLFPAIRVWNPRPAQTLDVTQGFSIQNGGGHAVTLDHVLLPDAPATHVRVTMKDERTGIGAGAGVPFRPFSLGPAGEEWISFTYRSPCHPIGAGNYVASTQAVVTYEFLGVHHQATIPLDQAALYIEGPATC
jgi:hypothetical protein